MAVATMTSMRFVSNFLSGTKVVVIGAGVVGSAIAYRLAQGGADVVVVERAYAGAGTSGASFAWLNAFKKPPREYHQLNGLSIREHRSLADEADGDWLHLDGALHWIHDGDEEAARQYRDNIRLLGQWGYRVDRTTPAVVMRELEPDLRIDETKVSEVYVAASEGWVEAVRMAHLLLHRAATRYSARLLISEVRDLRRAGPGVDGVVLDDRAIDADVIVNAAGPDGDTIARLAGSALAMSRQPGIPLATAPAPTCLRHVVRSADCFIRPDGGGRVLIHRDPYDSVVDEGSRAWLDHPIVPRALADARAILPALAGVRAEAVRIGVRAMPRDGLPIVGFDPEVAGLYHVVTHSGVTLSALLSRLVAEELSGGAVPELGPYRPQRFQSGAVR